MDHPIVNTIKRTIKQYQLIARGDTILTGISGGPDSSALLYLLESLRKEYKISLYIAHVNYMLRQEASKKDADFVLSLSKKLRLPIFIKEINLRNARGEKGSLEETARNARLKFFFELARKIKASKIALGHNRDDQSETVLMRLIRGSGLLGLGGILPKRKFAGFTIIRPLIHTRRKDIEAYLKYKGIKARIDSSNLKNEFLRNKIRNQLLAILEKYNPNIREGLANLAESSCLDYDFILNNAAKAFKSIVTSNKKNTRLSINKFFKIHPALQNMLLRLAFEAQKGSTNTLTYHHIKELRELASSRPENSIVDLPSNISASKRQNFITFSHRP